MINEAANRFRRLGMLTICAVYIVILAGGIVRASGAGMGCPDWPTCFGQWIPPTSEAQLPENYHEIYAARGYENTQFNPVKTWTEYTNRLVGVTIGFLIFLTAWSSRIYLKTDKTVFYLAVSAFLLVGFQGWLGSTVVSSNLNPLKITIHMVVALLIVALLIYTITRSQRESFAPINLNGLPEKFPKVLNVVLIMSVIQITMGTQVREAVDFISHELVLERQFWRDDFPIIFYVHRSFSSLILFTNAWLVWRLWQNVARNHPLVRAGFLLMCLIVTAILAGVSLDRLAMPPVAQPIHLLMANLILGTQFFMWMAFRYSSNGKITVLSPNTAP
jgi:cytochrome c oxidase assembly protein subunit 15